MNVILHRLDLFTTGLCNEGVKYAIFCDYCTIATNLSNIMGSEQEDNMASHYAYNHHMINNIDTCTN